MTHPADSERLNTVRQRITAQGSEGLAEGLRRLSNEAMRVARAPILQAQPDQRTATRQGYANGFKDKTFTPRLGPIKWDIPQGREGVDFHPSALQKGLRSAQALKLALAKMDVPGVATRKVAAMVEELCGTSVRATQVSECPKRLDPELEKWRERPLGTFPYLGVDARHEKVRLNGQLLECAVRLAMGSHPEGKRTLWGVSVALSQAAVHWRTCLQSLSQRGLGGVQFMVSDAPVGRPAARTAVFPARPWPRGQCHLQPKAQA